MIVKNKADIERMRLAGKVVADTLDMLKGIAKVGVTTLELDKAAEEFIRSRGAIPSFLNYSGYPNSICASVNHQVVHGIPGSYKLKDGDILSVDVGAVLNGWHGDAARTFLIGNVPEEVLKLVKVTRECFFEGIKQAKVGNHVCDISKAIQEHAEKNGYSVVRELIGHGIGRNLHEDPEVPNYYERRYGRGMRLESGMTLAVEPMINLGGRAIITLADGWTVETKDKKPSAHYENTIAITDGEPEILTMSEEQF